MKPEDALVTFEEYLARQGIQLGSLMPGAGVAAVLSFYRDERIEDRSFENDEDMLLYQWGTYNWISGEAETFELDITRQLMMTGSAEDDDIWQLSLTFKFPPLEEFRAFGCGNEWCHSLEGLPDFEAHIRQSAPFQAVAQSPPDAVSLKWECVG